MAKSIQSLVYEELRKNILSLRLQPGQTMSTQEIATKLNVSRTPVREAFLKLQEQGLVEMIPQKETAVSKIDLKRADQEKFIRESLELGIVRKFMDKETSESKNKIVRELKEKIDIQKKCVESGDFVGFLKADDEFHSTLFNAVGETMAWDIVSQQSGHYDRMRILFVQDKDAADSSIYQHERIVEYLEENDQKKATEAMIYHISRPEFDYDSIISEHEEYFKTGEEKEQEIRIGSL